MKLGLVIKITQNGESELCSFGKDGQWDKYATDARSSIKELEGFDGTGKTVTLIKFLGTNGYLIGIIEACPEGSTRPFDNTAAWIHFPSHISISSQETILIIDKVKEAISGRLGIDVSLLKQLFDKDYSPNNPHFSAVASIKSNENGTLGVIEYGGNDCIYELYELLGEFIAQSKYATYKGIFLIDKSSNISLPGKESIKIDPKEPIIIEAPESNNEGFIPYICGQEFDKSVNFPADKEETVIWKKDGYADIPKKFVANDKFKDSDIQITSKDYKLIVYKEWFHVTEEHRGPLEDYNIRINGNKLNEKLEIPYDSLKKGVKLTVDKNGFDPYEDGKFHLIQNNNANKNIPISLKRKIHSSEFTFSEECLSNENSIKKVTLKIESNEKIKESPLNGFNCNGNNVLYPDNRKVKFKFFVYGIAASLMTSALFVGLLYNPELNNRKTSEKQDIDSVKVQEGNQNTNTQDSLVAINYLDNDSCWKKDSLEHYTKTKGLFEALNKFNINKIRMYLDSRNIEKIVTLLDSAKNKDIQVDSNYNENKNEIDVNKYIQWISKKFEGSTSATGSALKSGGSSTDSSAKNITGNHNHLSPNKEKENTTQKTSENKTKPRGAE